MDAIKKELEIAEQEIKRYNIATDDEYEYFLYKIIDLKEKLEKARLLNEKNCVTHESNF